MTAPTRLLAALALPTLDACQSPPETGVAPTAVEGDANPKLVAQTEEFERKVYTVTDGVYQAVGFGIANSIMVEGDECVFIVDVMGSMETAKEVKAEFDKITQKRIRALIYTHNHADSLSPSGSCEAPISRY